jgi:hypothetical protein
LPFVRPSGFDDDEFSLRSPGQVLAVDAECVAFTVAIRFLLPQSHA